MILNPELNPCDGFGVRIGAPPRESEREGERELGGGLFLLETAREGLLRAN